MHITTSQTKKPVLKALSITALTLSLALAFHSPFSLAGNSIVTPIPDYRPPEIKGKFTNNNSEPLNYASLGYPLVALGIGSGLISGLAFYKRKKQKDAEAINFIDPQTQ